ncbi:hypothetical protein PIB30_039949 [Stylosanthes scabra]|uniref:Uncharacterized protein n=1 Tax=Stylosanthes scabra TaxID=79078 RepID=A0ABU6TE36_9FABA|nr:hypothetical protein [Stylosanthes scabra]
MPHELDPLYNWVNRDVLGSPSTMTEDYLAELKSSGVICGEEERLYRVELPRRGERGNSMDKQLVKFDPKIERILTKIRQRVKLQRALQENPSSGNFLKILLRYFLIVKKR